MTWQEFAVARQHIAEERLGKAVREVVRDEDAAFAASTRALQQTRR